VAVSCASSSGEGLHQPLHPIIRNVSVQPSS